MSNGDFEKGAERLPPWGEGIIINIFRGYWRLDEKFETLRKEYEELLIERNTLKLENHKLREEKANRF